MEALNEIRIYKTTLAGPDSLNKRNLLDAIENTPQDSHEPSFGRLNINFAALQNVLQETDMPPTTQTVFAVKEAQKQLSGLLKKWDELKPK